MRFTANVVVCPVSRRQVYHPGYLEFSFNCFVSALNVSTQSPLHALPRLFLVYLEVSENGTLTFPSGNMRVSHMKCVGQLTKFMCHVCCISSCLVECHSSAFNLTDKPR